MSLHECPQCGHQVATNSTSAGAFELPPTLHCVHDGEVCEMDIVDKDVEVTA
ncbi:hypothetical protein [Halomarina oriensis]|uniref:Uncharacterized protein n=1 Tax=Halomarina oriensis TaxID=671145 RepID=A0A6B0GMV7_9EURY|nr:hypothetical protein [Halomarina oriensis]MWG36202.1 hypothetical protein [Halomarina oriensis]